MLPDFVYNDSLLISPISFLLFAKADCLRVSSVKVGVVAGMEVSAVASVCKSLFVSCSSNAKL